MLTIHSGGAAGSDSLFAKFAVQTGKIKVIAHSFCGHSCNSIPSSLFETRVHTNEEIDAADHYIVQANKTLKRRYPPQSEYVRKLLVRDVFQVLTSNCIFAVADLEVGKSCVKGGTGWAVQVAIDLGKDVFVFDRNMNKWRPFHGNKQSMCQHIEACKTQDYEVAGIGTRSPGLAGTEAIKQLVSYLVA